jgi:hypothetical protein
MFHEFCFELSELAVIYLLLSQEASAQKISLGLFSLRFHSYSPDPVIQAWPST